jgi:hypothetical protein
VDDPQAGLEFQLQAADLQRAVLGAVEFAGEAGGRISHLRQAVLDTPGADPGQLAALADLEGELNDILVLLRGDHSRARRNEPTDPSIQDRVNRVVDGQLSTTQPPTTTNRDGYAWAAEAFAVQLEALRDLDRRLGVLEQALEAAGAPWTPGRFPEWP